MTISAKVIADSITTAGVRLTTMQLQYPRFIHSEFMTHRVFSRNAGSSRAIPTAKLVEMVRETPVFPVEWGQNKPGMQAEEVISVENQALAKQHWQLAARSAAHTAEILSKLGVHKQVTNRVLEPFLPINVVVSSTEWANFYALRDHKDAQPEIRALAIAIKEARGAVIPVELLEGDWHLPYVDLAVDVERIGEDDPDTVTDMLRKLSVARCARVSYKAFDGTVASVADDVALFDKLVGSEPGHWSPTEHQATPDAFNIAPALHGNFRGWVQFRKTLGG
jgi:thymidylate synthase ThyX